jgi:hypothetical protein
MDNLFTVRRKKLVYKNIYYFNYAKKNIINTSCRYLIRVYYFFKLINFFKRNGYNKNLTLKIFLNNYYYLWLLFLQNYNLKYYYQLLKKILLKYNFVISNNYNNLITFNNIITPTHFLNYNNIDYTENIKINFSQFKLFLFSGQNINNLNVNNLNVNKFLSFNKNNFTLHFIRIQRRYNKRRYSKVRVVSRSSFFGGISFSSILIAILWNGSIKSVDWLTAWIIVIDINLILIVFILYYLYRLYRIYYLNIFIRKRGKIKIINSLNTLLTNYLIKYLFK